MFNPNDAQSMNELVLELLIRIECLENGKDYKGHKNTSKEKGPMQCGERHGTFMDTIRYQPIRQIKENKRG